MREEIHEQYHSWNKATKHGVVHCYSTELLDEVFGVMLKFFSHFSAL